MPAQWPPETGSVPRGGRRRRRWGDPSNQNLAQPGPESGWLCLPGHAVMPGERESVYTAPGQRMGQAQGCGHEPRRPMS
eukprot:2342904-Pyramimonas_sp.AAC.1